MITEKTVFVLGAGASKPYGYPTGAELRKQICSGFVAVYNSKVLDPEKSEPEREVRLRPLRDFTETFFQSSTKSIDLFLSRNPRFSEYGKQAIITMILRSEMGSSFREDLGEDHRKQDWYFFLFDLLTTEFVEKDQYRISENEVSFITFNYDRSLEHFLHESLLNSFAEINPPEIEKEIKKVKIHHIFGQVANLKWQDATADATAFVPYKPSWDQFAVSRLTKNIRVMYSELDDLIIEEARRLLVNAERIFFLGFGYANENLQVLGFPNTLRPGLKVYGTAFGLTEKEIDGIKRRYFNRDDIELEDNDIILQNADCLSLLREYL